jgi:hypothetical protein
LHLKKANKALWNGSAGGQLQRVTTTNNPAIFAYTREKENDKVFAILNFTNKEQKFIMQGNLYPGTYRDVFEDDTVSFNENTEVTLPAWGYKLYEIGSGITEVEDYETQPAGFNLRQNYPNPFNPETTINFSIPETAFVSLTIYNLLGEKVTTLLHAEMKRGSYKSDFNAAHLNSGVYFFSLRANDFCTTKKMVLMK